MHSPLLAPVIALVLWTFVMWFWPYATRIPAMARLGIVYDADKPNSDGHAIGLHRLIQKNAGDKARVSVDSPASPRQQTHIHFLCDCLPPGSPMPERKTELISVRVTP